ncbi:hypothetical protein [Microbispora triticiradicis]|uniref:hypothetical protein n=1 Tax=Microbispora triticiradicis TaxID=2200763 RepID=UPI001AD782C8|nr:hypothetical protein [Microbispora triticiradicis]MBO4271337.1 hypothetical protein [Microbispora triticiradicis]
MHDPSTERHAREPPETTLRRPAAALAALALLAVGAACTSEQPDPAAGRTRLTITHPASPTAAHTVVFEAVSQHGASSLARVSWSAKYADGGLGMSGGDRVELPYAETVPYGDPLPNLEMWVFNAGADDTLICRIRVDGAVVVEESSGGYYNSAFCQTTPGW